MLRPRLVEYRISSHSLCPGNFLNHLDDLNEIKSVEWILLSLSLFNFYEKEIRLVLNDVKYMLVSLVSGI